MHVAPSFPNLAVLLIDASVHYRRIIRSILYQSALEQILEAGDLPSAADIFVRKRPNIVILDWDLPDNGGPKCLKSIRSFASSPIPRAPVIVTMERPERRAVLQAAQLGANEIVVKPISPKVLWLHLAGIINIPRSFEEQDGFLKIAPRVISNNIFA